MRLPVLLLGVVLAVSAKPRDERIIGGTLTTIDQYPYQAALLMSWNMWSYSQFCGATIVNTRSLLTAAHCFWYYSDPNRFRVRVGSTYANSGGVVHGVQQNILHPSFNRNTLDSDVAIVRVDTAIVFNANTARANIAGAFYNLQDQQVLYAIGWGYTTNDGLPSEQLRQVLIWSVNQQVCRERYAELGAVVTDNMVCAGWLDVGGRDQCHGDSGGPLLHNHIVIGVCSWGAQCGLARYPGVNARVSRFTTWIQANA